MLERLPTRAWMVDYPAIKREAQKWLGQLHLTVDPAIEVSQLSVAQAQLVEIAKALSIQSRILLLDEPTASITPGEAAALGAPSADGIPGANTSPPTGGPTILIARNGTSLTLSWSAADTGFTLESADSLSNPTWTAVSGVANNSVTVQIGAGSKFYRLRK